MGDTKPDDLFAYTLDQLKQSPVTRSIPDKLLDPKYDRELGEKMCQTMFALCNQSLERYTKAIKDFIEYSMEFLRLQIELEKTGKYLFSSYSQAQEKVYDNPLVMETRYLNGLLLSQALWINHHKMLLFFLKEFSAPFSPNGKIIEVPVGSGVFISEFMRSNPQWVAEGYDISASSVTFSKKVLEYNGIKAMIHKENIFDIPSEGQYDKVVCGELLEHLEDPKALLKKLKGLLKKGGTLFLTTAVWAAAIDHIYLFKSAQEVRDMLEEFFDIEKELVLNVFSAKKPEDKKTPINYACILKHKSP